MRIILSRKGVDAANGGIPSPILNDNLISLPISRGSQIGYQDLTFKGISLGTLARDLSQGKIRPEDPVHLDPDLRRYSRKKLKSRGRVVPALIRFGDEVAVLLKRRAATWPLFPYLRTVRPCDRATEFKQRCDGLKIKGVSLHSYRYAWAERALKCGYPERFAQQSLGHNSKAVHHSYSKHAEVTVPSLGGDASLLGADRPTR